VHIRKILLGTVAAAAMSVSAQAAPVNATGGVGIFAPTSTNLPSIAVGSVFNFGSLFGFEGSLTGLGDLASVTPVGALIPSITASNGSAISFSSAVGSFLGTVSFVSASGPTTSRVLEAYALGTFTPAGSLSAFSAGPMSITFSATQSALNGAVSASFSLASPPSPPPGVPAPAALALFGLALAGLGVAARARKA